MSLPDCRYAQGDKVLVIGFKKYEGQEGRVITWTERDKKPYVCVRLDRERGEGPFIWCFESWLRPAKDRPEEIAA